MKNYDEIARDVFAYRDEYVARQKRTRKTVMRITSVACAFAVVAAVGVGLWQGGGRDQIPVDPATPSQSETDTTESTPPTTEPSDPDDGPGIGGDGDDECKEHSTLYHAIEGSFKQEQFDLFHKQLGENYTKEEFNIVNFVKTNDITKEAFIECQSWDPSALNEIVWEHGKGCPYTKEQFLEAIYGDNAELTAWVFAPESTWPKAEKWSLSGRKEFLPEVWPPEGYGFGESKPSEEE